MKRQIVNVIIYTICILILIDEIKCDFHQNSNLNSVQIVTEKGGGISLSQVPLYLQQKRRKTFKNKTRSRTIHRKKLNRRKDKCKKKKYPKTKGFLEPWPLPPEAPSCPVMNLIKPLPPNVCGKCPPPENLDGCDVSTLFYFLSIFIQKIFRNIRSYKKLLIT